MFLSLKEVPSESELERLLERSEALSDEPLAVERAHEIGRQAPHTLVFKSIPLPTFHTLETRPMRISDRFHRLSRNTQRVVTMIRLR